MTAILIISPEPWDGHAVSKHHYALTLVDQGQDVLFFGPPTADKSTIAIEDIVLPNRSGRLRVVHAPSVSKGLAYMPGFLRNFLEHRWLRRLERAAQVEISTIWLFENSRFFDMRFAKNRLKIYHQVDLNQNFHPQSAAQTADVVFCTTDIIRAEFPNVHKPIFKIHHGTSKDSFANVIAQEPLITTKGINAVYIGNLDMKYLDTALFTECVKECQNVNFHIIGGSKGNSIIQTELRDHKNAFFWGKIPHAEIPQVLQEADLLLVFYKEENHLDQASPHKFMEYLASGKVIVSTYTDEYRDKRHLLEMVDQSDTYLERFNAVVADLPFYNSAEKQAERMAFAQDHTYTRQLDRIIDHLDTLHLAHNLKRSTSA